MKHAILGEQIRVSDLLGKHFTNWAVFHSITKGFEEYVYGLGQYHWEGNEKKNCMGTWSIINIVNKVKNPLLDEDKTWAMENI